MTAITIGKDKAIELLEKQVEKKGADYVYPYDECIYFADGSQSEEENGKLAECGTPLCILGNVYADLGLTADDLRVYQTEADYTRNYGDSSEYGWYPGQAGAIGTGLWDVLPDTDKVELTPEAIEVFHKAQTVQDRGESWGKALEAAKAAAK